MDVSKLRDSVIAGRVTTRPNIVLVKDLMQTPENHQFSLGVGHQLTPDLALNADFVHQDVRHLYTRLNANYLNTTTSPGTRVLTSSYGDIILWDDFARARFDALVVAAAYRRPRLLTNLSYTLGFYKADYDAVTAPAYAFQSSYNMQRTSGDERHRIVLSEVATLPWLGLEVSGIATVASPRPFTAFIGQDLNHDNDVTDDYFPSGDPAGLRTQRPSNAWKNWYRNLDLRAGAPLVAAAGTTLRATVEIFNVFNTNNVAGFQGRQRNAAGALLVDAGGRPTFGTANSAFGARRVQAGLRAEF
jgi:hypothetical protein